MRPSDAHSHLLVGEVLANTTAVLDAPVLESIIRSEWTVIMDGLYVDGRFVSGHSNNSEAYANAMGVAVPAGGTLATFDTGTTFGECFLLLSEMEQEGC